MTRTRFPRCVAATCALGLLLTACGGSTASDSATSDSSGVDTAVQPEPAVVTDAPAQAAAPDTEPVDAAAPPADVPEILQFSAPLVGGGNIDAAALAGKPTIFWFWAPT